MTDHPILFSAPMIRALLDGRKTQTRRVLKPQPKPQATFFAYDLGENGFFARWLEEDDQGNADLPFARIPAMKGDRLWVREAWSGLHVWRQMKPYARGECGSLTAKEVHYWADGNPMHGDWERPRPSIHMPRWASRLTLIVTGVKAQRLQDISEEDASAEGCFKPYDIAMRDLTDSPYRTSFARLWSSINGPDAWEANPWVTAITFTVHRCNIDKIETDQWPTMN